MIILLIVLLSVVMLGGIGFVLTGGSSSSPALAKRTAAFGAGTSARAKRQKNAAKSPEDRRKQITEQLKEAERRDRKARLTLRARMLHAGLEPNIPQFIGYSSVMAGVGFIIAFLLLGSQAIQWRLLISAGAAFGVGYGLPRWVLSFMCKGRVKKFTEEFPNAMDILVRGIKSGLPVHDGLKIIAKESSAPLGPEFQRLCENVGVGMSLDGALEKMTERVPSPELRFFAIVIAIQQKTGGNLAEALGNLSAVLRARKMMREKIKALSSEAIASAFIIGSMPPGVGTIVTLVRPAYIGIMFSDTRGQLMLLGGAVWMGLGILFMRKMINFKI